MKKELFWAIFKPMNTLLKKSIYLFLLFLLSHMTSYSQSIYSKENLRQASLEELNVYLKVSQKLKRTGTTMSIAGPVATVAGYIIFSENWDNPDSYTRTDIGGWIFTAGFVTTLIGVPILITGSSRVKRITRIMDARSLSFEIAPCSFHTLNAHSTHPGITFRLTF
jgi:hypothetical protein